jgi:hypothetical protein
MDGLIFALGLGKFNSVNRWYDNATKATTFGSVKTTRADLGRGLTTMVAGVNLPR